MKKYRKLSLIVVVFSCFLMAQEDTPGIENTLISQTNGIAINGYDPVAYFTEYKAVHGIKSFAYEWNDVVWYFSNEKNRDLFVQDPTRYAPQYGGYCAYSIVDNQFVPSDPQFFTINDDKLYLYKNKEVKEKAQFNFKNSKKSRDKNWLKFNSSF